MTLVTVGHQPAGAEAATPGRCQGQDVTLVGTPGNDTLTGTPGPDVISGLGGRDVINALGGRDIVCGGAGGDRIRGGPGQNDVLGGAGPDILVGGPLTSDVLRGSTGDDTLRAGPNGSRLDGGPGADRLFGSPEGDQIVGGGGDDVVRAGGRPDQIAVTDHSLVYGGDGADTIEVAAGCRCDVYGEQGDDRFWIRSDDVRVFGADGDDRYVVAAAVSPDERLAGGTGRNHLELELQRRHSDDATYPRLFLDLREGLLRVAGVRVSATDFDVLRVHDHAPQPGQQRIVARYELYGDGAANSMAAHVTGEGAPPAFIHGRGGRDDLRGGAGDDLLDGGEGQDLGQGRRGTDTCVSIEEAFPLASETCEIVG
jgi:Ca2+-binding RTX toxin-like protein